MRLPPHLTTLPTLCAFALVASACAKPERIRPLFPPAADVQAVTEAKPAPGVDIVTSARAAAEYDIAVEMWGERVSRAGGRICRWALGNGASYPFICPEPR